LFVGVGAFTAAFRSIPGTQPTTRATAAPPLNMVAYDAGAFASMTGTVPNPALDFSGTNTLNFRITTGANDYDISLSTADFGTPGAPTATDIAAAINAELPPGAEV